MYIRIKVGTNEMEFDNKCDSNYLVYRHTGNNTVPSTDDKRFKDLCDFITHVTKELKTNYD